MKLADRFGLISLALLAIFLSSCNTSPGPKYLPAGPWNQQVGDYEDSGHDFETTINDLTQKFRVPVGMDLETLSDRHAISVRVPQGKVADILNVIVAQQRGFKWEVSNGVVNIGPQPNTHGLVDLQIAHFHISRAGFDQVHAAILSLPEVKRWFEENHVTHNAATVVIGGVSPGQPFKPLVSLDLQNIALREVLNGIIKCPGYRVWSVAREEEEILIGID
jgi:hypothetical protein